MTRTARQVVDDAYAALFGRCDLDGFLADFDENSVFIEAESLPYGGTFRGRDAIKAASKRVLGSGYPNIDLPTWAGIFGPARLPNASCVLRPF